MNRTTTVPAGLLLAVLTLTACGGGGDPLEESPEETGADADGGVDDDDDEGSGDDAAGTGGPDGDGPGAITIGSANFPGNVLLAEIYAAALEDEGVEVTKRLNIGNRETYIAGLDDGSIDLIPEYTGALTLFLNPDAESTDPDGIYEELQSALPEGLTVLDRSEAEDKDAIVVTAETAEDLDLTSIADLEAEAPNLVLGGPPEFADRFTGVPGLEEVYGLEFAQFRALSAGSNLTAQSLLNGQVDAANIFTTDPAIVENDFVVLEDPENLFVAQNILPLATQDALNPVIEERLNEVSAELSTEVLNQMMVEVISDGEDPAVVAEAWVAENVSD